MRRQPDYEWLEHTADIRVHIRGESEADLIASAALTMSTLIAELPDAGAEDEGVLELTVERSTMSGRIVELLRELLFIFDVDSHLLVAAEAVVEGHKAHLSGRAVSFDPQRHVGLREIKAVTYHQLDAGRDDDGWWAEVVFDV